MYRIIIALVLVSFSVCGLQAQELDISKEMNIRGDFAYEMLPKVGDKILLYRDRGNDFEVEVFNEDLVYKRTVTLSLRDRRVIVEGVSSNDSTFTVFYSYKENGIYYIKAQIYDEGIVARDTLTLLSTEQRPVSNGFRMEFSEDRSKALVHGVNGRSLFTLVYDLNSKALIWNKLVNLDDINVLSDFLDIRVSNEGRIFVFFEKGSSEYNRDDHKFFIYASDLQESFTMHLIDARDVSTTNMMISLDEYQLRLKLIALAGTNKVSEQNGIFSVNIPMADLPLVIEPNYTYFDKELVKDVYGKKQKKKKYLKNFDVEYLVDRADGGIVCIAEMNREYGRRANYGAPALGGSSGYARQYVDFYTEDMITFSINPDGIVEWRKVLYKKQFSQDDNNIYSSFFMMNTPSRMHLIFNDEISTGNTVSEYVMDPLGNFERNSVISTEYQNLKLRFRDAIQIESDEFLVPSENGNKLSLVKMKL